MNGHREIPAEEIVPAVLAILALALVSFYLYAHYLAA
jgi:hypothetical protein